MLSGRRGRQLEHPCAESEPPEIADDAPRLEIAHCIIGGTRHERADPVRRRGAPPLLHRSQRSSFW